MTRAVGSPARARGCERLVLTESVENLLFLRPLGSAED